MNDLLCDFATPRPIGVTQSLCVMRMFLFELKIIMYNRENIIGGRAVIMCGFLVGGDTV